MSATPLRSWGSALLAVAAVWLAMALLLQPTFLSMVEIWERSETFAHGYVILPVAMWMLWRQRHALAAVAAAPDLRAAWVALALLLLWMVARASGVLVVEQYAFVALWLTAVWGLLGKGVVRAAAFPLLFLLLMVPNGEFLIPPLIEFTAEFTVLALRLIGIPVFREGPYFSIPSGDWNVVEGCSGLRYLIASITLGLLYAYLTYRTPWKRAAFTLAAIAVPVMANGMRATMIVLIAHYSDMKLALGVDHFIYGWVWFGIVMLAMFWIGMRWREDVDESGPAPTAIAPRPPWRAAALLLAITAVFPLWLQRLDAIDYPVPRLQGPQALAARLAGPAAFPDWKPHWVGMDAQLLQHYRDGGEAPVLLYVAHYARQRQDAELVNTQNYMIKQKHHDWRKIDERPRSLRIGGRTLQVVETRLAAVQGNQRILIWNWNRVGGRDMLNPYLIKLRLALVKLSGGQDDGTAFVLAAPYQDDQAVAARTLFAFLGAAKEDLDRMADQP